MGVLVLVGLIVVAKGVPLGCFALFVSFFALRSRYFVLMVLFSLWTAMQHALLMLRHGNLHRHCGTKHDANASFAAFSLRVCAQLLLDSNPSIATLLFWAPGKGFCRCSTAHCFRKCAVAILRLVASLPCLPRLSQKLRMRTEFLPPVAQLYKVPELPLAKCTRYRL